MFSISQLYKSLRILGLSSFNLFILDSCFDFDKIYKVQDPNNSYASQFQMIKEHTKVWIGYNAYV